MFITIWTILWLNNKISTDAIFKIGSILGTSIPIIPNITEPITIPAQHNPNINNHFTICNITINVLSKKMKHINLFLTTYIKTICKTVKQHKRVVVFLLYNFQD